METIDMRIAQVAPLAEAVPPKLYGGTERIVSYLTEELVAQGHDVTLFASGDSETEATLAPMAPRALRLDKSIRDPLAPTMLMLEAVARRADEFDVIHFHLDYLPFSLASRFRTPSITTLHGRLDLPELGPVFDMFPDAPVVSISDAQRRPLPQANWIGTVHHGLPGGQLRAGPGDGGYLAFLGRISPEKGVERAIRIADQAGMRIRIAAKIDDVDRAYYEREIRQLLVLPHVEYVGEIGEAEKSDFLGGATALLFPIDWPEPFGLVMIEAMACGTPIIAFDRGAVPEIIVEGVNGFIVEDVQGALGALHRLDTVARSRVRQNFEERFSARRMADDYVALYQDLTGARQPRLRIVAGDA
jgi:glycosyltransferase involved in cell wall biosynthesis